MPPAAQLDPSLTPWASPFDCSPGWTALVPSQAHASRLAAACGGTAQVAAASAWNVIIRRADLIVTALAAEEDLLRCTLAAVPDLVFMVRLRRRGSLPAVTSRNGLPATGVLTVRQFWSTTRMGRLFLAEVPAFTAAPDSPETPGPVTDCPQMPVTDCPPAVTDSNRGNGSGRTRKDTPA